MLSTEHSSAVAQLAELLSTSDSKEDLEASRIGSDTGELVRHLEGCSWDVSAAEAAVRATASWRVENKLQALRAGAHNSLLTSASDHGNLYVRGYDRLERPIVYVGMGFDRNAKVEGMLNLALYCIERAVACIERQELEGRAQGGAPSLSIRQLVLLVNFSGYSRWRGSFARQVLSKLICTMEDYYPMRLGAVFLIQPPCCFWTFFSPMLSREARSKVQFLRGRGKQLERRLAENFDLTRLETSMCGTNKRPFSSKIFLGPAGDGREFGLEFDAQAASELTSIGYEQLREEILLDPRMRTLRDDAERELVLSLGRALQARGEGEDSQGLFDDAGALIRYLRARKWDLTKAEEMIRSTARWRQEFGFAQVRTDAYKETMAFENATGKMYCRGFDRKGRPILYMKPRLENSSDPAGMCQHLVYNMERCVACLKRREQELFTAAAAKGILPAEGLSGKLALLVDFNGYSLTNSIRVGTALEVLSILQDHYPERLGQAFLIDPPWIFSTLWSAVSPFVDPVTAEKIQIVTEYGRARKERLNKTFDLAVVEEDLGGYDSRPFDSAIFLNTEVDGTAFGLDYREQLELHDGTNGSDATGPYGITIAGLGMPSATPTSVDKALAAAVIPEAASDPAPVSFWAVCSDPRVLVLPKERRTIVRALARCLIVAECGAGLFDDAGSLLRYLEATNWKRERAEAMLQQTARWRYDFGLDALRAGEHQEQVEAECAREAIYVRGYDLLGRPIVYIKPALQHGSWRGVPFMRYLVYCLERATACVDAQEAAQPNSGGKLTLLVDFAGFTMKGRPPMRIFRRVVRILQDHYPERLGSAILLKPPRSVLIAWRFLSAFLDAKTYAKFQVVNHDAQLKDVLSSTFNLKTLERGVGGENDITFDKDVFLHRRVGVFGTVFGVEFDEQWAAKQSAEVPRQRPDSVDEKSEGWLW